MMPWVTMSRTVPSRVPILLILLLAFALRVYHLDFQSIWWDEGHSIEMASAPLPQIATLPGMDVHPPGYFMALHLWMDIAGMREFALRYLSVAASLLSVALLVRFGRDIGPGEKRGVWAAYLCGGLAALLPLYVAYAQEVRMYAMVTCLALLAAYAQWRILFRGSVARRWWVVYVLATVAGLYTHYFCLFLIAFQGVAWLAWVAVAPDAPRRRRRLSAWIGSQLAVLVLFAPQLPLALQQTTAYANPNLQPPSPLVFLSSSWLAYTAGLIVQPALAWLAIGAALLTLTAVVCWIWRARRQRLAMLLYLLGWFCIPLALYFVVLQSRPSFEPRYMIAVTPALLLLWGGAFTAAALPGTARRAVIAALVPGVALAFVLGAGTASYFTNAAAFKDDSAGVVRWLASETTSDDLVYVDVPHPFHYYADRIAAPMRYLFVDIHTAANTLNAQAAGRRRLYWVTWYGSDTDPRGVIPFLLDKAARRAGERDFRGYHAAWWELPADVRFSLPDNLPPADVVFGSLIRLDGVAYGVSCRVGRATWATLHFALLGRAGVDYRASLRLRDAQGNMLPPTDRDILNDRHVRTAAWLLDDARLNQAINVYTLPVPPDTAPGDYRLELVVYDAATSAALAASGASSANGISAFLGTVHVLP